MPRFREERQIPFAQDIIYGVIADVARYGDFLPWCIGTRVFNKRANEFDADVLVGFKMFRERYTSRVTLTPETRILSKAIRGPLKFLTNDWQFEALAPDLTRVTLDLEFEFSTRALNTAIGEVFGEASRKMVDAFSERARKIAEGEDLGPKRREARRASSSSPFLQMQRERRTD